MAPEKRRINPALQKQVRISERIAAGNITHNEEGGLSDPIEDVDTTPKRGPMNLDGDTHHDKEAIKIETRENTQSTLAIPGG